MRPKAFTNPERPAALVLLHGIGQPSQLEFPEHPEVVVQVPGALGIVLIVLELKWASMRGQATRNRGWLNKQGLHETYMKHVNHQVSALAVGKYSIRLITKIEAAFRGFDEPPILLERDGNPSTRRGTHLVRDLEIRNLGGTSAGWSSAELREGQ